MAAPAAEIERVEDAPVDAAILDRGPPGLSRQNRPLSGPRCGKGHRTSPEKRPTCGGSIGTPTMAAMTPHLPARLPCSSPPRRLVRRLFAIIMPRRKESTLIRADRGALDHGD